MRNWPRAAFLSHRSTGSGALARDVSEWTRFFASGMFYAFTLALAEDSADQFCSAWPLEIAKAMLAHRAYLVAAVVLPDVVLLLASLLERRASA